MSLTLAHLTGHDDANFRRLTSIWEECRTRQVPSRRELSLMKLLPVSGKVVILDIAGQTPTIVYSGSDSLPFFYFDPAGVSLMQAFSYDTYQEMGAIRQVMKAGRGVMLSLKRGEEVSYDILLLPVRDDNGRINQVVVIGAHASDDAKDGDLKALVSNHDAISWQSIDLPPPAAA